MPQFLIHGVDEFTLEHINDEFNYPVSINDWVVVICWSRHYNTLILETDIYDFDVFSNQNDLFRDSDFARLVPNACDKYIEYLYNIARSNGMTSNYADSMQIIASVVHNFKNYVKSY